MSYNIFNKNASFQGTAKGESGSVEYLVDTHTDQSIGGTKTFTGPLTSSTGLDFGSGLISGSGNISASFFYGDATNLINAGTITSYTSHATDRLIAGGASSTAIKGLSDVTFTGGKLGVTGQISASLGVSGTTLHGAGGAITALDADNISAGSLSAARLDLDSAGGLENNSDSLRINLSGAASGLSLSSDGITLDVAELASDVVYGDTKTIIVQDGAGDPKKQALSVLEASMTIAGGNITGTAVIPNAALPTTISVAYLSGNVAISGAFFHGDGAGLTGVTSTPTPAGSNTEIQFNDDGAIAADADLTFLTGSNTLATSNLSASVNISGSSLYLQDEIYVGGQAFLDIETNVAANNASFTEITASSTISSSADIYGANFRGNGSTLNNVPMSNYASNLIIFAGSSPNTLNANNALNWDGNQINTTGLSASADVKVGGHITGSGDIVLLGTSNSIIFDTATGTNQGPLITAPTADELVLDGDSYLKLRSDSFVTIQHNTTDKFNFNFSTGKMVTAMVLSSSAAVSASIVDSLTGYKLGDQTVMDANANMTVGTIGAISFSGSSFVSASIVDSLTGYKLGDQTVMDSNANVTCGTIGSQNISIVYDDDVSANALDFGAGAISGSGNISGSAFFGDGSNLQNMPAPTYRYHYLDLRPQQIDNTPGNSDFINIQNGARVNRTDQNSRWVAPASGSIARVVLASSITTITAASTSNKFADSDTPIFFVSKNNSTLGFTDSRMLTMTASLTNMKKIDFTTDDGTVSLNRVIFDIENNQPTITGSNSFDPGDILQFQLLNTTTISNPIASLVFKFTEEGVTYP